MTVDWPEHRSFNDAGSGPPLFYRNYRTPLAPTVRYADFATRAVLISFGTAEGDFEALTDWYHIVAIQADQFRPSEAAREAEQQQRSIPDILEPRSGSFQDQKQVILDERGRLPLSRSFDPF
jgi:hypothetical protein